jgi:hypothetical protein
MDRVKTVMEAARGVIERAEQAQENARIATQAADRLLIEFGLRDERLRLGARPLGNR